MTNTSCALRLPARPAGELIDLTEVRCRLSARAEEESLAGVAVERYPSAALCPGQAVSPLPPLPRRSRARRARRARLRRGRGGRGDTACPGQRAAEG